VNDGEAVGWAKRSVPTGIFKQEVGTAQAPLPTLQSCHHPRKRMIQYSRAVAMKSRSRGVLDTPHARGMTTSGLIKQT
jgi:hypothetical protein